MTSSNSSVVIMQTSWRLGQLLLKWLGSLQQKHFGLTGVFLVESKSMGMGFPGDGHGQALSLAQLVGVMERGRNEVVGAGFRRSR